MKSNHIHRAAAPRRQTPLFLLAAAVLASSALPSQPAFADGRRSFQAPDLHDEPAALRQVAAGPRLLYLRWLSDEMASQLTVRRFSPDAVGGPSTWNGGVGNWSNGAMWTPIDPPNNDTADVSVDGGNTGMASIVSVDGNFTVGRLTIDLGDTVGINDNRTLTVSAVGGLGAIINNGTIAINSGGNGTSLGINGNVSLSGSGATTLSGVAFILGSGRLTNSSTINGQGNIGNNAIAVTNAAGGLINANVNGAILNLDPTNLPTGFINQGTLRASNGSILQFTGFGGGEFVNTGGTIQALDTSEVRLINGASISGGTLTTAGTGVIAAQNGNTVALSDLTNTGLIVVRDNAQINLAGTIVNNATISLESGVNSTRLSMSDGAILSGTGTVLLGNSAVNFINGSGTFTNAATHTIAGGGNVGTNAVGIANLGLIEANVAGVMMTIDPSQTGNLTNNGGTVQARNGAILQLTGNGNGSFNNTGGIIQALDTSEVRLVTGASISGGTLTTAGTGVIAAQNGNTVALSDLTNTGLIVVRDNAQIDLAGTIVNNATISLESGGNGTRLSMSDGAILSGNGTVMLGNSAANLINGSGTFTNAAGHTIAGGGNVGTNAVGITNLGLIEANVAGVTMTIDPSQTGNLTNNGGTLSARNGGLLLLTGNGNGSFDNAGGMIQALAGSQVQLTGGASITGGTLTTAGDGLIRALTGQNVFLTSLTNAGAFAADDNTFVHTAGQITNNGTITLNTVGNSTDLVFDADTSLAGNGTVLLTGDPTRVRGGSNLVRLTNGASHTISGRGQVGANVGLITNLGLIDANLTGGVLAIDPAAVASSFLNQATMQATNGGVLRITGNGGGEVTNTGGTIQAVGAGSEVQLTGNASIVGGTLLTSAGGVLRLNTGQLATISDLTIGGNFIVDDNSFLHLNGTITNNGSFTLASLGNGTDFLIDTDTIFAGSGTVSLTGSLNARIRAGVAGTHLTIGANQIFSGMGQIGFNNLALTNLGMIDANLTGQVLELDAVNVANGFLNQSTMQASGGGILRITGNGAGDITNTGAIIQAVGAGSEVQLTSGGSITGGTLATSGGGVVRLNTSQQGTISNLTNAGTFVVNDNSFLHTVGTITNNGTITLSSAGNGSDILLEGDVTFAGTGTVTLAGSNNARVRSGTGTPLLTNGAGHTFNGRGQIGFNNLMITNAGTIDANVSGQALTLDPANTGTAFLNDTTGTVRASGGGTALLTGNGAGSFTNNGIFEVLDGSSFTLDSSAILTNNVSGVLTLGSYRAFASGNGATLTIRGANITQLAANTEVILSGAGSIFQVGTTALESTLLTNNGVLRILDNRNYTNVNNLTNAGVIELGGGIFDAPILTIDVNGELFGFGTVTPRPTNSGLIRAVGGTLAFTNGIQGGSGTVQIDSSGILNLSTSAAASSADFLVHNGSASPSLLLGSQNFVVGLDYTNANFGVGNSFDPRANVSGAGLIFAAGDVGQSLTGNVTGGTTANAVMAFGNIHVGDALTMMYQINNTGTSGPVLRGALQTAANGGNITDGRLLGAGVTASNWGPIGLGDGSSDFAVTFNGSSAGALSGQTLHILNNFGNVGDQNLSFTGAAFRFANPTLNTATPIALGNFHVGDVVPLTFLSLTNNVPDDGFSEALNAMIGGATGGVVTNNGSINLLLPGTTNSTSLGLGINTAAAGNQGGSATITVASDGSVSSFLGITNLPSQIVNVTAGVFRYASPVLNTPEPVAFGARHVGDVVTQALSVTNNVPGDGFSEALDATFTGTTGGAFASGGFNLLGAGLTNSSDLVVGLNTSVAGNVNGTAVIGYTSNGTGTSGLGMTVLGSQTVNVSGAVYRYANPTPVTPAAVAFGIVHVGDSVAHQLLSVTNNVPNDGFSESLNGSIGGATGGVTTNGGSFTGLAALGTNNTSLGVGINTATAGNANGTATVSFQSNGTGSSGLGNTNLPGQTVNVTGQVNFYADPVIVLQSGPVTLIMNSPTLFTLDFGSVMQGTGNYLAALGLLNFLHDAIFQDTMGGTFDLSTVNDFGLSGFDAFSGIGPGGSVSPEIVFNSAMAQGSYSDTLFWTPTSGNTSGVTNLAPIQLNVQGQVIPEPSTWALLAGGAGLLIAFQRGRRRR